MPWSAALRADSDGANVPGTSAEVTSSPTLAAESGAAGTAGVVTGAEARPRDPFPIGPRRPMPRC